LQEQIEKFEININSMEVKLSENMVCDNWIYFLIFLFKKFQNDKELQKLLQNEKKYVSEQLMEKLVSLVFKLESLFYSFIII
jgi:hypothetical protein